MRYAERRADRKLLAEYAHREHEQGRQVESFGQKMDI
jgi:hypothetical protein